jgi:hypothetical protein
MISFDTVLGTKFETIKFSEARADIMLAYSSEYIT